MADPDDYRDRLVDALAVLKKARDRMIALYHEDNNRFIDAFIRDECEEEEIGNLPLPIIYGIESILLPVGYFQGLLAELKIATYTDELAIFREEFSYEADAFQSDEVRQMLHEFDSKCSQIIQHRRYDTSAKPYGDKKHHYWDFDAMAWAFGAYVDVLDFWSQNEEEKASSYLQAIGEFLVDFFIQKSKLEIAGDLLKGMWYCSPRISNDLAAKSATLVGDSKKVAIKDFTGSPQVAEALALFSRSVLAVFDVTYEALRHHDEIRARFDQIRQLLTEDSARLTEEAIRKVVEDSRGKREYFADYTKHDYFTQILGALTSLIQRDIPKEKLHLTFEENFIEPVLNSVLTEIKREGSELNTEPKKFRIWTSLTSKDKEKVDYEYVAILPILLRSLSNLMHYFARNEDVWRALEEKGGAYHPERKEEILFEIYDLLQDSFYIQGERESGLWQFGGKYELAYTAFCVDAITLYCGYLLRRCTKLGLFVPSAAVADMSNEEREDFTAFQRFRDRINEIVARRVEGVVEQKLQEKLSVGRTDAAVPSWFSIFLEVLTNDDTNITFGDGSIEKLRWCAKLCEALTKHLEGAESQGRGDEAKTFVQQMVKQDIPKWLFAVKSDAGEPHDVFEDLVKRIDKAHDDINS